MLNHIIVENFKAWEKLDISFGSITGLFGTNSSGKSSLLQMLLLLKHSKDTTDRNIVLDFGGENKLVNLGTYRDIIHNHDEDLSLNWSLDWKTKEEIKITDPNKGANSILFQGDSLKLSCDTSSKDNVHSVSSLSYQFAGQEFSIRPKESGRGYQLLPDRQHAAENGFSFTRTEGRAWELPKPMKTYLFPDQAKTYFQNSDFLSEFELEYELLMDSIYYLGPLREYPKRRYSWSGPSPEGVGQRGERTVEAILSRKAKEKERCYNVKYRGKLMFFEEIIAFWLKELGLIYEFKIEEISKIDNLYKTVVTKEEGGSEVALTDVGFGVSQILPVLVLLYYVPENSIVLLEQPEIHLHPAVQSNLADLMISVAERRNIQIIVESHSEHLLRRFQRRIAEAAMKTEDLKLYFFKTKKGKAQHDELKVNLFGEIENWPKNFFGDEMAEIAATRIAALKRKKATEAGKNSAN